MLAAGKARCHHVSMIPARTLSTLLLLLTGSVTLALWMLLPPLAQDPVYHAFADRGPLLGIPHGANVLSNLGFLAVGLAGLWRRPPPGLHRRAWQGFYLGLVLTALGSGWYHLAPDDARLAIDRAAMAIAFMSLLVLVVDDRLGGRIADRWLWPLLLAGLAAVLYWHVTEQAGHGDLRPYLLVQFLPLLLLPVVLLARPTGLLHSGPLWLSLGLYVLAKAAEAADEQLLALTGVLNGHAAKHLLGALAGLGPLLALRR
jgi:hypothetical protein